MRKLFRGLLGGLAFETTFSLGTGESDFWAFVNRGYLFPVVGLVVGGVLGGVGLAVSGLPRFLAASLFIIGLYVICGILHADGLADLADALVTGGTHKERTDVMKDEKTGAAGLITILAVNLLLFSSLVELFSLDESLFVFSAIVVAEVLSREAMVSVMFFGKSAHEGLGSTFVEKISSVTWGIGTLFVILMLGVFRDPLAYVALGLALMVSFVATRLGNRVIGGINGDIVGATGEIVRPLVLVSFVLLRTSGFLNVL